MSHRGGWARGGGFGGADGGRWRGGRGAGSAGRYYHHHQGGPGFRGGRGAYYQAQNSYKSGFESSETPQFQQQSEPANPQGVGPETVTAPSASHTSESSTLSASTTVTSNTVTMRGVIAEKVQAPFKVVDDLKKPTPGEGQILVKSICTAINPVDSFMANYGLLVVEWPLVLGCDASGVVVEVGAGVTNFKKGDAVCGCTRLGHLSYSTGQEFFLMDAAVTIPKPKNISFPQAATLGVGSETAALGVFNGLHIDLPDPKSAPPSSKDEWVLILGGSSSVGKYAIQYAKYCGYRVIASCSAKSAGLVKSLGAEATVDYKKPHDEQIATLKAITGGKLGRIMDAAAQNHAFARKAFEEAATAAGTKYFTTTNDWEDLGPFDGVSVYLIRLGPIGRPEEGKEVDQSLGRFIPVIVSLVESGKVVPSEYEVVGKGGFEGALEAYEYQQKGAAGAKKVVVRLQDE